MSNTWNTSAILISGKRQGVYWTAVCYGASAGTNGTGLFVGLGWTYEYHSDWVDSGISQVSGVAATSATGSQARGLLLRPKTVTLFLQ